jgi:protein-tyrosine-phosphatase
VDVAPALDFDQRVAVHAALGDPIRLAMVDALVDSDRTVTELRARSGVPSNLLAHHLDVLEAAGVIARSASHGDGRRRYVRLRPEVLSGSVATPRPRPSTVLFVCTQNSARSQLAAALWHRHTGVVATSAGTEPADRVHPLAVAAAKRRGIDLGRVRPRPLTSEDTDVDVVITVCDRSHESLAVGADWWHWSIADPVELGTPQAFDNAFDEIEARVLATR